MDHYLEETTPKGITLKVLLKKSSFLAFDKDGRSIYSDEKGMKVLHVIPVIVFMGSNFRTKNTANEDLSFLKIARDELVIPYINAKENKKNYMFIPSRKQDIDLMPVKLKSFKDIYALVREIDTGLRPDYIIIDPNTTKNDIIVIKNRYPEANIMLAKDPKKENITGEEDAETEDNLEKDRAKDAIKQIDINMMSNNPVFLARVHLRDMNLSKVKQLMLDFELTPMEIEYIINFLDTMLNKSEPEIQDKAEQLKSLRESLLFYLNLLTNKKEEIKKAISELSSKSTIASYSTLVSKVKLLQPDDVDQLDFTEYENLLWEKKEEIK